MKHRLSSVGFALLLTGAALAGSPDEDAARTLFKEGLVLHESKDYAHAVEKYRAAYARWKNPKILANIGTAAWELGRFAEAAAAYDEFLATAPAGEPTRKDVEKALRDVLPRVGTLDVRQDVEVLQVAVDGVVVDATRLDRVRVAPGQHDVEATDRDGTKRRSVVQIGGGQALRVIVPPQGAAPTAGPAPAGAARATARPLPKKEMLPWIVGGVGAAGLAASGIFLILRGSAIDELESQCIDGVCPSSSRDSLDSANRLGTLGLISLGVGVVGIGAGVYLAVGRSKPGPEAASTGLGLGVAADGASLRASAAARF